MESRELDRILQVVENPVRRRIIKRLSREPSYELQLSKDLGLGQSLVAKHLNTMKEAGLVTWAWEDSEGGPKRKRYTLTRGISIAMDFGPNLFIERGTPFESRPKGERLEVTSRLKRRVETAAENSNEARKISLLSDVLRDVDGRMREIDEERAELLGVRNLAMSEVARVVTKFEEPDMRKVLFHVLDEHDREVERISEALNLREFSVRSILDELRDYLE